MATIPVTDICVAVIGGGWAGLAAASELVANNIEVTVFEAARQAGGRARTVQVFDEILDNCPHLLIGAYQDCFRLFNLIGIKTEEVFLRQPLDVFVPKHFRFKLPKRSSSFDLLVGLIKMQGASWIDRFHALRFLWLLHRRAFKLEKDEPLSQLLTRFNQAEDQSIIGRFLWQPLCLAALNTPAERASAQVFANVLRDTLNGQSGATDFLLATTNLSALFVDPAIEFIKKHGGKICLSSSIQQIRPLTEDSQHHGIEVDGEFFSAAIIATAPRRAATLLSSTQNSLLMALADQLMAYEYEPLAAVYIKLADAPKMPVPLLALSGPLGQWLFDLDLLGRASCTLCFVLSGTGKWQSLTESDLVHALLMELAQLQGRNITDYKVVATRMIKEQRGTFSCQPDRFRPHQQTDQAMLWLAGDYCYADYPATLESAVRSGVCAANLCMRYFNESRTSPNK